jgi:hypothetical protein
MPTFHICETQPMKKFCEAAVLKFARGVLKDQDVPVGEHDVSRVRVILTFPEGAAVNRIAGSEGDGQEAAGPSDSVSAAAALLFIQKAGVIGPTTFPIWMECIREAAERELKAKDLTPPEAKDALKRIEAAMPKDCKRTKATPATCIGVKAADVSIERLTIANHTRRLTSAKH